MPKVQVVGVSFTLDVGRIACAESIAAFLRAADGFSEYELLGGSRCHGWTRLDVVVHVIAGWQEMLTGLVSPVDLRPTVDAATYWSAFASEYGGEDPVLALMSQRRRAALYTRPAAAKAQLHDVAAAVLRGVAGLEDTAYAWQGHVFAAGDFAAVWAVEDVVHHLDLRGKEPAPGSALGLAPARRSRSCSVRRCLHRGRTRRRSSSAPDDSPSRPGSRNLLGNCRY